LSVCGCNITHSLSYIYFYLSCGLVTHISFNLEYSFFLKLNTVKLFISVFNQLDAQNLFHNKFYLMPLHVSSTYAHHQVVKIALHGLWYHHTYRWPSRAWVEGKKTFPFPVQKTRGDTGLITTFRFRTKWHYSFSPSSSCFSVMVLTHVAKVFHRNMYFRSESTSTALTLRVLFAWIIGFRHGT